LLVTHIDAGRTSAVAISEGIVDLFMTVVLARTVGRSLVHEL
jgi:hypothetical protein